MRKAILFKSLIEKIWRSFPKENTAIHTLPEMRHPLFHSSLLNTAGLRCHPVPCPPRVTGSQSRREITLLLGEGRGGRGALVETQASCFPCFLVVADSGTLWPPGNKRFEILLGQPRRVSSAAE